MSLLPLFFYLFSVFAVASAVLVVVAKNPVHSVMFLIFAFFNAAGLFILLGAEFLAMVLVIVYVGAVAVLFLFVVMMLDVDFAELKSGFVKNAPVGLLVGGIVLAELALLFLAQDLGVSGDGADVGADAAPALAPTAPVGGVATDSVAPDGVTGAATTGDVATATSLTNTEALGQILYTKYAFFFEMAGLVLLVAMIGAIVLTLRHKDGVRRQSISDQVARDPKTSLEVVKVTPGGAVLPTSRDAD